MDDFEVAFQSDDHETDLSCRYAKRKRSSFYSDADDVVDNLVAVVDEAVRQIH